MQRSCNKINERDSVTPLNNCVEERYWSRGRELNSRPADYESAALPLSYLGAVLFFNNLRGGRLRFFAHSLPTARENAFIAAFIFCDSITM